MIMCTHNGADGTVLFKGPKEEVLSELAYLIKYSIVAIDSNMALTAIEAAVKSVTEELKNE